MLKSSVQSRLLQTLPDDRPITALQIVEDLTQCPRGFYPISKTYDQDSDADLGGKSIFKTSATRYLCLSKTEGIPNFALHEILLLADRAVPPKGFNLLNKTADSHQRPWKKKQLSYQLVNQNELKAAVTDIIVCNRLRKAPAGFRFAGEINGVTICYKMGNVESTGQNANVPDRPPKTSPGANRVYPPLGNDDDYEILRPGPGYMAPGPIRPAPKPPGPLSPSHPALQHQTSTHTLGSLHAGLEGVPFVVNPRFLTKGSSDATAPKIRAKTMQQILKEYDYPFIVERHLQ